MSIGNRIKEERERLGYSQEAFGSCGGISKRSQIMYEQDKTEASATYFTLIDKAGADVKYILTGEREVVSEKPSNLQPVPTPKRRSTDIDVEDMRRRRVEKMAQLMEMLTEEQQKEMFFIIEKECEFNQMKSQLNELQQRVAG